MSVRLRLMIMMFLEYFIWGAWAVEMGGYMGAVLKFTGLQIGWVYTCTAIGAMISPLFLGYLADRLFSSEKMVGILHLLGAGLLAVAATQTQFLPLFIVMVTYAVLYTPTLALTNSISFHHIDDPDKEFPIIRVLGTLGWIVAGLIVGFLFRPNQEVLGHSAFLYLAAAASLCLGVFSFLLPYTPPASQAEEEQDETAAAESDRQGILQLLTTDRSFLVFAAASFLICIPLAQYYNLANLFLTQRDYPAPTALQTLGQMSEVVFMCLMPWFISVLGVKRMLGLGMLAWVVRYACFGTLSFPLVILGLLLHGICYDFFFVASQIYVDNRVDVRQRARAQSFVAFLTYGAGMFVGSLIGGRIYDFYPPTNQADVVIVSKAGEEIAAQRSLPDWESYVKTVLKVDLKKDPNPVVPLDQVPEKFAWELPNERITVVYSKESLLKLLKAADADGDGKVTRTEWFHGSSYQWPWIWFWPGLMAAVTLAGFWLLFQEPKPEVVEGMIEEAPLGAGEGPEPQVG